MYEQSFSQNTPDDEVGISHSLPSSFRVAYSNLALALGGRCGSKAAKTPAITPATLILFCRDGGVGFVIAPKDGAKNAHGFIREPDNLLVQIEAEIEAGRIGWKPASRKRS